jgi:hypothetical protein
MFSQDINFNRGAYTKTPEGWLETRNENNFNAFPLLPGSVVVFPEDEIECFDIPIRKRPNKDDETQAEKNVAKKAELEAKIAAGEQLSNDEERWMKFHSHKVTPELAIPVSTYMLGKNPDTNDGVLVYVKYLNSWGRRTADGQNETTDQLSRYCQSLLNDKARVNALLGKTIVVDDKPSGWFVRKFGTDDYEPKKILVISIKDETSCQVEQPNVQVG